MSAVLDADAATILVSEAAAALAIFKYEIEKKCPENFCIVFYQGHDQRFHQKYTSSFDYTVGRDTKAEFDEKMTFVVTSYFQAILLQARYAFIDHISGKFTIDMTKLPRSNYGVYDVECYCGVVGGDGVRRYNFSAYF